MIMDPGLGHVLLMPRMFPWTVQAGHEQLRLNKLMAYTEWKKGCVCAMGMKDSAICEDSAAVGPIIVDSLH